MRLIFRIGPPGKVCAYGLQASFKAHAEGEKTGRVGCGSLANDRVLHREYLELVRLIREGLSTAYHNMS